MSSKLVKRIWVLVVFFNILSCSNNNSTDDTKTEDVYPFSDKLNIGEWEFIESLSDEFEEVNINLNKWTNLYPGWNGRFPSLFVKDNAYVNNGELNIVMKQEQLPEMEEGYEYSTGVIRSLTYKYRYSEIKAKCMNSAGRSAFFLNNVQADWWTEIDVFEIGGNAIGYEHVINTNIHEFYNQNNVVTPFVFNVDTHYSDPYSPTVEWRPADDYHIYGIEWDEESIKWYIYCELFREIVNSKWHQEQYINIESETMPDWLGLPNDDDLQSVFYVEYIRTWQKS